MLDRSMLENDVRTVCVPVHRSGMPAKKPPNKAHPSRAAFARRLEAARIAAGYETMREFAVALGITEARYRRWEAAETEPGLMFLNKIHALTGVSLDTLISGEKRDAA